MIWIKEKDSNIITCNIIVVEDNKQEELKKLKEELDDDISYRHVENCAYGNIHEHLYYYSLLLLKEANGELNYKKESRLLLKLCKNDLQIIELLQKIYNKLDINDYYELMNKISPDFYIFVTKLLDVIRFKEIKKYDVDKVKMISDLCEEQNIRTSSYVVLDEINDAENNSEVLKLAQKIRTKER